MRPYLTVAALGLAAVLAGCNKPAEPPKNSSTDSSTANMAATSPAPSDTRDKSSSGYASPSSSGTMSSAPSGSSSSSPSTSSSDTSTNPSSSSSSPSMPGSTPPASTQDMDKDKNAKAGQ